MWHSGLRMTAVAQVTAVARVQSLAQELPHAVCAAKRERERERHNSNSQEASNL